MSKSPKRPKQPRDVVGAAVRSMQFLTDEDRVEPPTTAKKTPKKKR